MARRTKRLSMLDYALRYAKAGLPVIPLHSVREDGSCTCGNSSCKAVGKHPRTRTGLKEATTDEATIRKWWGKSRWPNASIGGVGGANVCLDIDAKSDGLKSLEQLIADNAPLPDTFVVETGEYDGERGRHYWFKCPEGLRIASRAGVREGIDIRAVNGYAVMPPSTHASGVRYEQLSDLPFSERAIVPEFVAELSPEVVEHDMTWEPNKNFRPSKEVKEFITGEYQVPPGEQREFLVRAARSILTTGRSVEDTARLLLEGRGGNGGIQTCDQDEDEPWTDDEILFLVEDVFRKGPNTPLEKDFSGDEATLTDLGNARRLIAEFPEGHVFHVTSIDTWFLWNEDHFVSDPDGVKMRTAWAKVAEKMLDEGKSLMFEDDDKAKRLINHALRSQQEPRMRAAVSVAADIVPKGTTELNVDAHLLQVENGVVDLRTGGLLDPDPSKLMTRRARARYKKTAKSKVWNEFLKSAIPDRELRKFIQKVFGYSLTGSIDEHKFFYFHGPPAAGKSTLVEAVRYLLNDYAITADPMTFMRDPFRTGSAPSEDIARLADRRMVVTHEIEEGQRFAEGHISKLTGGDSVSARFLHKGTFSFYPKFKLFFTANHKPRVTDSTHSGIWRRILVIPMEEVVPEDERDPTLSRKLRRPEVLEAILAWAVEGARLWYEDNEAGHLMEVPGRVKEEVQEYQRESDHVGSFFDECVKMTMDPAAVKKVGSAKVPEELRLPQPDLFSAYQGWCKKEGRRNTLTASMFAKRIKERGVLLRQVRVGDARPMCWLGLELRISGGKQLRRRRRKKAK